MLSCLNLSKKYGKILFNELDINLEKGEILAILSNRQMIYGNRE